MQAFDTSIQPLGVQNRIDLRRVKISGSVTLLPRRTKRIGIGAAAIEAWAMPSRECRRLVEEEQFGPALCTHHVAAAATEFADADNPRFRSPAPLEQRARRRIVNDATIAGEQSARGRRDDVAQGGDAILQGQGRSSEKTSF
jgi:hypothetical protein